MLARVPDRYPITTLETDEHDVYLTVGEVEMIGRVRWTNTGKARYQIRISQKAMEDLPPKALVALWRPVDENTWPYDLPEPATLTVERDHSANRTENGQERDLRADLGAGSHVYLGRPGEAPIGLDEVEQRIIRGLRTASVLEREVIVQETLWPRPWMDEVQIRQKQLDAQVSWNRNRDPVMYGWRPQDYEDYFVDRSALNARPVRFEPTPRDVSDYEARTHIRWLDLIPAYDRWLFHARAKLPPLDWWQIADEERVDEHVIVERYQKALERIFKRVRGR